jgi:proteasome lid subunit RPN8/RPN11
MGFLKKNKKKQQKQIDWKIKHSCLDLIIESAKSVYPNEFGGMLSVDDEQKYTISEIVLLPGTVQGESHAIFKLHMMPIDFNIVGTVHSHPSPFPIPSDADLELFGKHGKIHIIIANPYNHSSWKAYDYNGKEIKIEIV